MGLLEVRTLKIDETGMHLHYIIDGEDFDLAGDASSKVKKVLNQLGVNPSCVKKVAISMYEAEINAFIHGGGGDAKIDISKDNIVICIADGGKGIADIDQAMQEGYSTATDQIRQMGFGAGMGLPNIKRNTDNLEIKSKVGAGTTITMTVNFI